MWPRTVPWECTNGSGHEGPVSKGLVNVNDELKDATDMAESGCGELDDVGVVARVGQPFSEAEGSGAGWFRCHWWIGW